MELLDAQTLARLAGVKLRARAVVEGVLSGLHKSPHQGQSVEFAEHKEYAPGDEIRHLDWKAFGKFDKYYVKRFEHETNLRAVMVVDALGLDGLPQRRRSPSWRWPTTLAGALCYLLVRQQDAAGAGRRWPARRCATCLRAPRAGHLNALLDALEALQAQGHDRPAARRGPPGREGRRAARWSSCSPTCFDDAPDALKRILAAARSARTTWRSSTWSTRPS